MEISCSFATSLDTPDHIAIAERLGYRRAWCYGTSSSPASGGQAAGAPPVRTRQCRAGGAVEHPDCRILDRPNGA